MKKLKRIQNIHNENWRKRQLWGNTAQKCSMQACWSTWRVTAHWTGYLSFTLQGLELISWPPAVLSCFVVLFVVCSCALCFVLFSLSAPVFARWQHNGLCIDPISSLFDRTRRQDWRCYLIRWICKNAILFPVCWTTWREPSGVRRKKDSTERKTVHGLDATWWEHQVAQSHRQLCLCQWRCGGLSGGVSCWGLLHADTSVVKV